MSRNEPFKETHLVGDVARTIEASLPVGWTIRPDVGSGGTRPTLTITSAVGEPAAFEVVTGRAGNVSAAELASPIAPGMAGLIYISKYIPAPTRAKLKQSGVSYADTTGWLSIVSDRPMLAVTAQGASKSPQPSSPSAVTRLNGRSAGRIIRTLLTVDQPLGQRRVGIAVGLNSVTMKPATIPTLGVRELADKADVAPGTVSKTLPTLVADGCIARDQQGRVTAISRRQLLDRWTTDYRVLKSNGAPSYWVVPRGIDAGLAQLADMPLVGLTGGKAGALWLPETTAPLIPVTQLVLYAANTDKAASELGLVPVDPPSANVIVLTPQDPAILARPTVKNGSPVAPLPIVLADLLTLPGRYPLQAEALMDALAKTDPAWRS